MMNMKSTRTNTKTPFIFSIIATLIDVIPDYNANSFDLFGWN